MICKMFKLTEKSDKSLQIPCKLECLLLTILWNKRLKLKWAFLITPCLAFIGLSVSVSLNKILSKKIIVPWDQLAEFWRFVYAYMYENEREMFEYTWLNLPRLRLETYARFYQQRNFAWFLNLKKRGGGVLSLRNRWTYMYLDRETCKCILHWRSEFFFSCLMKVAWLTN